MPIEDFLMASGIRVHARKDGLLYDNIGRIVVSKASQHGIDQNLWACLKIAVDQLSLVIGINSIDTGKHVPGSRHYDGRAVDINRVGPEGRGWSLVTPKNPSVLRLVRYLRQYGFRIGEGGPWPALLLGPPHTALNPTSVSHRHHLHVSLPRRQGAGAALDLHPEPEPECENVDPHVPDVAHCSGITAVHPQDG